MPNQIKLKIVEETQKKFENSSGIYFTKYTGLNVKQATNLRKKFKESSVEYVVTKNTLTKIAAKNAGFDESIIDSLCNGQIGIAYSENDPTAPAKVIKDFVKENEDCLEVTGLFIDGENFDASKYKQIANMPSKEELLTKFVVGLNSPMTKFATMLKSVMVEMVTVINAVKETKE